MSSYLCYTHNKIDCNECGYSGNGKYLCTKHNVINCNQCGFTSRIIPSKIQELHEIDRPVELKMKQMSLIYSKIVSDGKFIPNMNWSITSPLEPIGLKRH